MGVSTDAILFYGYAPTEMWSDDDEERAPWHNDDDNDPERWVASLMGVKKPDVEYDADPQAHRLYWNDKSEAIKGSGIDIIPHCCDEYFMYGLAAKETVKTASRGFPERVMEVISSTKWDEDLDAFISLAKLDTEKLGPRGWWLVSWWG